MILLSLLAIPVIGILVISTDAFSGTKHDNFNTDNIRYIALAASVLNLIVSLIIFILFDFSSNQFQFVQES